MDLVQRLNKIASDKQIGGDFFGEAVLAARVILDKNNEVVFDGDDGLGSLVKKLSFGIDTVTTVEVPFFTVHASAQHSALVRLTAASFDPTGDPLDPAQNPATGGTFWLNISGSHWGDLNELIGGALGGQAGETASFTFFADTVLSIEYDGGAANACTVCFIAEVFTF
jgi:hypothetical protein